MGLSSLIFINAIFLICFSMFSDATDIFNSSQSVGDGSSLVSGDGMFELGFFSPGNSKGRYLGIWYKKIPVRTVVWVANRRNPISDTSGLLFLNEDGNLLLNGSHGVVWSSNSTKTAENLTVQLLDSGNLVIRDKKDGIPETVLWQSFDYPTDTLLPGMKVGWDLRTGLDRRLSAWKSSDDPSPGDFNSGIELYSYPDDVIWKGSKKYLRRGPWNGLRYSGSPIMKTSTLFQTEFVWNKDEVYFSYYLTGTSVIGRYVLNQTNYQGQRYLWIEETRTWLLYSTTPRDFCDNYGICGAYASCDIAESPYCQCLKGFKPKSQQQWDTMDWSHGCVRNKPLNFQKREGFIKFSGLKLPDTTHSWVDNSISLKECRAKCLKNSSCMAYTNTDITGKGSGCAIWFGDLIDIKQLHGGGQDLYIRMSASETDSKGETGIKIAVITSMVIFILSGVLLAYCCIHRPPAIIEGRKYNHGINDSSNARQKEDTDFQLFNLDIIAKATNDFSLDNKLGEGGFGSVYKGTMVDGQEIAVKRLSRSSGQGSYELENEIALIAKLQHRNLVKLLGYCIPGEEKILVYEFMPNKSLDFFIFDNARSKLLDWSKRFHIICGVARGLVYLHQDSRLRIIHRDLKASNVLLDAKMNPKISDFGLARTFKGDQTEGSTNRVVGTYGYMAPEFAIDGKFSVKSDVFSFGILILEIISGKKNTGFYYPSPNLNLIGHAWELWKERRPLQLIDSFLEESCSISEVVRCIHISLLCLQQHPEDRPSMSSVILMLGSETALPQPKEPGFLIDKKSLQTDSSLSKLESFSTNDISISLLEAR